MTNEEEIVCTAGLTKDPNDQLAHDLTQLGARAIRKHGPARFSQQDIWAVSCITLESKESVIAERLFSEGADHVLSGPASLWSKRPTRRIERR